MRNENKADGDIETLRVKIYKLRGSAFQLFIYVAHRYKDQT